MKIAFSLPVFIRDDYKASDLKLLYNCISTLGLSDEALLVIYNQGYFSNNELKSLMKTLKINCDILGDGTNVGIPIARQKTFEYIWSTYPTIEYIGELHLDMIFYNKWYEPLMDFLNTHPNEPMISPGLIDANGFYVIDRNIQYTLPKTLPEICDLLQSVKNDIVHEWLVHPAIHKSQCLKDIGGIDLRFFKGKQGYEDYSILIGYHNYIGSKNNWKPKLYGMSTVYHAYCQQRWTVKDVQKDIWINEEGLFNQYGAYGFKYLSEMLNDKEIMGPFYEKRVNNFINWNV